MSARTWIILAGVTGALGVAFGAFGAHVLPSWLARSGVPSEDITGRMEIYEIGVRYHMYHALALLGLGLLALRLPGRALLVAGLALVLGIILFSGLLYALAITGFTILGAIVPIGGVLLIVGWVGLAWAGAGNRDGDPP